MGPYQVSSNYSPGVKFDPTPWVKFDPTPGVTSFTWDYIGKILEISLYVAIRPRVTKFCMCLYQECPNYSPGIRFGPAPGGVTSFTLAYIGKILEISLYLALRPRDTKFCM